MDKRAMQAKAIVRKFCFPKGGAISATAIPAPTFRIEK
jgi:hypothetical protein